MPTVWMEEEVHDQGWKEKVKRKRAQSRSDINIGKKGVTEQVLREIRRRLEDEGIVKIRVLKSALAVSGMDRRELARMVAEEAGAFLVEVRGRTFILVKPMGKGRGGEGIVYKKHRGSRKGEERGLNR